MIWHWIGDQGIQWNPSDLPPDQFLSVVRALLLRFDETPLDGVRELVPGFSSVVFLFLSEYRPNPQTMASVQAWVGSVQRLGEKLTSTLHTVPVHYDGPDLAEVASWAKLSIAEVIAYHAAPVYTVQFIGFLPGFPYLHGLDPRLACPRRSTPRRMVPAGSVAIGGEQTGIYPSSSPGGWNLLGTTTISLFSKEDGAYFAVGDRIKFVPV